MKTARGVVAAIVVGPKPLGRLRDVLLVATADEAADAVRVLVVNLAELLLSRKVLRGVMPARGQRNSSTGFGGHRDGGASCANSFAATVTEWAQEAIPCGDSGGMADVFLFPILQTVVGLWEGCLASVKLESLMPKGGGEKSRQCSCQQMTVAATGGSGRELVIGAGMVWV